MADENLNQSQDQTSEEIEKTPGEMDDDALEQVSGGMGSSVSLASDVVEHKVGGNLASGEKKWAGNLNNGEKGFMKAGDLPFK